MATVHPHKGYLNSEFKLYAQGDKNITYKVYCAGSNENTPIITGTFTPNTPHAIRLKKSGSYKIKFSDGTSSDIFVEDGYKFGGSSLKKSFIFDEIPWCFVIMNDRTYFYNRETDESYVEIISPDEITPISKEYVIFKNTDNDEQTIFSLLEQKPILNILNIITFNTGLVVWQEKCENNLIKLNIFSLSEKIIKRTIFVTEFMVDSEDNALIYSTDKYIYKLNLQLPDLNEQKLNISDEFVAFVSPNLIISKDERFYYKYMCIYNTREYKTISKIKIDYPISSINSKRLIDIDTQTEIIKAFDLSQIKCDGASIKIKYISFDFYPTDWDIYYIIKEVTFERNTRKNKYEYSYAIKSLQSEGVYTFKNFIEQVIIRNESICFFNFHESLILGKHLSPTYLYKSQEEGNTFTFVHNNDVIRETDGNIYILNDTKGWVKLETGNYYCRYFNEFGIIKNEDNNSYIDLYGHNFSGYAIINNKPFRHLVINNQIILQNGQILSSINNFTSNSGIFNLLVGESGISITFHKNGIKECKTILSELYDSSSYKSVLLSEDGSKIMYRDKNQTMVLDVHSNQIDRYNNLSYIRDINGFSPHFSHRPGSLQPKLIDPVSREQISCERMPNYHFISPNGCLYADTNLNEYVETWNLITNKLLSVAEIQEFADNFYFSEYTNGEKNKLNENKRRIFIESNLTFFKKRYYEMNHIEDIENHELIKYLLKQPYEKFHKYFLENRGVVLIRKKSDDSVFAKIYLDSPLWFLNYVSFSYDNKYVAIAGRYYNDSQYGGLFLVYDLETGEVVINRKNSWAVWITAFNKQNHVASYSSEPITYDAQLSDLEKDICVNSHNGLSFLTFSPDGKYVALSNQGYISKYDKQGNERKKWGHMSSCDVYVVKSSKMDSVLFKYSDLSKSGIDGLSDKEHNCPESVSSVSFSNDNKRLMMVGNDGVVIIRNLHLD